MNICDESQMQCISYSNMSCNKNIISPIQNFSEFVHKKWLKPSDVAKQFFKWMIETNGGPEPWFHGK